MIYNNMNSGYSGYAMSKRAVEAYDNGEKPLSKFGKEDVEELNEILERFQFERVNLKVWQLKAWLKSCGRSSWHHTSSACNRTDFYSLKFALTNFDMDEPWRNMTKDDINNTNLRTLYEYAKKNRKKRDDSQTNWYYADVCYGEWEGSKRHPKLVNYTGKAIIIEKWAYLLSGGKKKADGSHFNILKRYGQRKPKDFDSKAVLEIKKKYNLKNKKKAKEVNSMNEKKYEVRETTVEVESKNYSGVYEAYALNEPKTKEFNDTGYDKLPELPKFEVIEDNCGGLHLIVFDHLDNAIYYHTGFEYYPGELTKRLEDLKNGVNPETWGGNCGGYDNEFGNSPQELYEELTESPETNIIAEKFNNDIEYYPGSMGSSAAIEFSEEYNKWANPDLETGKSLNTKSPCMI